jgi:transcriptional regulator GlxA family with amidase domain
MDVRPRTLEKSFTYCGKKSPRAVLQDKRLEEAMRLLNEANPDTTVESVARQCHISRGHFAQYFLRKYGIHPSKVLFAARAKRGC